VARPVRYSWYESDILEARHETTWGDADWVFQIFAGRLAHGQAYAAR